MFKFLLLTFTLRGDKLTVKYKPSYYSHIYLYSIIISFIFLPGKHIKTPGESSHRGVQQGRIFVAGVSYPLPLSLIPYLSSFLWDQSRRERVRQKVHPGPAPGQVPHSRWAPRRVQKLRKHDMIMLYYGAVLCLGFKYRVRVEVAMVLFSQSCG